MIKKLNFDDEELIVNWLSFKIDPLDTFSQDRLADYLVQNGFNSYLQSRKTKSKEILRSNPTNRYNLVFLKDIFDWPGTILQFSGINAREFYKWLKQQETIDWSLFKNPRLSRVDLNYTDDTLITKEEVELFFQACQRNSSLNNAIIENDKGYILNIGRRTSDRYSRIYTRNNHLRFEHEMKGRFIEQYSNYFERKSWKDFEDVISQHFLQYFGKSLPLDSVYLEWLVIKLRSIRPEPVPNLIFKMDYINKIDNINDQKKVVQFLKFLIYAKDLYYVTESLGSTRYRCVSFRVQDFFRFQQPNSQKGSKYQIQKMKEFFEEFETGFFLSLFRDHKFQKLISIPKVEFWREKNQYWVVQIWIVDELFYYNYPFAFPDLFDPSISKLKFAVQFEIIRVFSAFGLEKRFYIEQFIKTYPFSLSNQAIRQIKEFFIESVKVLEENNLIQPRFVIFKKSTSESVNVLTCENISEGFILYEQLNFLDLE